MQGRERKAVADRHVNAREPTQLQSVNKWAGDGLARHSGYDRGSGAGQVRWSLRRNGEWHLSPRGALTGGEVLRSDADGMRSQLLEVRRASSLCPAHHGADSVPEPSSSEAAQQQLACPGVTCLASAFHCIPLRRPARVCVCQAPAPRGFPWIPQPGSGRRTSAVKPLLRSVGATLWFESSGAILVRSAVDLSTLPVTCGYVLYQGFSLPCVVPAVQFTVPRSLIRLASTGIHRLSGCSIASVRQIGPARLDVDADMKAGSPMPSMKRARHG